MFEHCLEGGAVSGSTINICNNLFISGFGEKIFILKKIYFYSCYLVKFGVLGYGFSLDWVVWFKVGVLGQGFSLDQVVWFN